jgi:hypothetical protein
MLDGECSKHGCVLKSVHKMSVEGVYTAGVTT